jgi:hypothetical protein
MFVKFDCGCVGLIIGPAVLDLQPNLNAEDVILIDACDRDQYDNPLCFGYGSRSFAGKTFEPLNAVEVKKLADEIHDLMSAGYRLQTIKAMLR